MKKRPIILTALLVCALIILASATGCGGGKRPGPVTGTIVHEPEFGGVYISYTIDEFNALGYVYGDSVDILFSNGYELTDIPYYNGFYTENGQLLLVAYPGYDDIKVCINSGDDLWDVAGLRDTDTAEITLHEGGKYKDIQDAQNISYTDIRGDYASDEIFANFRSVKAGNIAEGTLYRSASPCDDQHKRAAYVNELAEEAGIRCIIDLADNEDKIQGYLAKEDFNCPYFLKLYENGDVIPLALDMKFTSDSFRSRLCAGLTAMTAREGPYLVHCTEGKDRTGFVCMLLEALCGASYDEIVDDYMITYYNYYKITEESDPGRYTVIVEHLLDPMIQLLFDEPGVDIQTADLSQGARQYLMSTGMNEAEIDALAAVLTERSDR